MFAEERKQAILSRLQEKKKVTTQELAVAFDVSEATIRRDIAELDEKKLLLRTHGGAMVLDEEMEPSYYDKVDRYREEKERIAEIAAAMIRDGDTLVLDGGTTTLALARALKNRTVTILTNAIDIALLYEQDPKVTVILTGGDIRWNTRALVGPVADRTLATFRVQYAFIGANGVDDEGIMTANATEAQTKRAMLAIAKKSYCLLDHSKVGRTQFNRICSLGDLDGIISDREIEEPGYDKLRDKWITGGDPHR